MATKIGSAIKAAPAVRKPPIQQQPAPANQYRKYFYSVDPDTGAEVLDEDFREYFYKQTGGRINPENLDELYLSYAQEKTSAQREESGLDKIKYPKWYDPTGKVDDTRQFYNYMKAYDALPQSGDYSSLDYLRKLYDQDKQSIEEYVQYRDTLATEKAKAKALGLSYTEGMALPMWNAESPLAKYYAYTNSEEDKQRQQYGLPPVSYTSEFSGTEGKAAMLAGELPASVRYTQNLYDEYAALVDEVIALAEAGKLNEGTLADASSKYAALADLRKYYASVKAYEAVQEGKTESQKRLEEITGTGEKPPKALFNEGMLADLGLGATFYDDLLARGTAYQAQTRAQRTAEKRGKQLAFWMNALQKGIGMAAIDAARGTTPEVAQIYGRDTGDGRDDTVYIGAGEPPRSEVQESIWFQIPDFSKDIDLLMKDVEAIRQSDPDRLGSTIQRGWKSGQLAYLYNIEMAKEMLGQENRAEEIRALLDDPVFQTEPKNLFLDIVESSVEQTPRYWEALRNLIMPESPGTLPEIDRSFAGTLKDFAGTLGDITMLPALYWEMAGGAYAGQIQAGVAEEVAAVHAPIQGMVDTFIEVAQLDLIFGGAKKLGGVALKKISNKAIARIAKALGGAFTGYGSELGEELAQEINAIVWEELGKGITGQMTGEAAMPTNFDEVTGRLSETLVEASKALVPTIFGGFVNSAFDTAAAPIKWDAAVAPEAVSGTVDAARIASENVAPILDQIAESGGDVTKVEALVTDTQTIAAQEPVQAPQTAMGAQGIITPEKHSDAPTGRVDALQPVDNRTANVSREMRAAAQPVQAALDSQTGVATVEATEKIAGGLVRLEEGAGKGLGVVKRTAIREVQQTITESDELSLNKLAETLSSDPRNNVPVTVRPTIAQTKRQEFVQKFAESIGLKVVYFTNTGSVQHNEFVDPGNATTVFINAKGKVKSTEWVFGHGLFHSLKHIGVVEDVIKTTIADTTQYNEEQFADELGNAMADHLFWARLKSTSNKLFNEVVAAVQKLLEKAKKFIGRETGLFSEASEIDAFRDKMAEVISTVAEMGPGAINALSDTALLFSEWDGVEGRLDMVVREYDDMADLIDESNRTYWKEKRAAYEALREEAEHKGLRKASLKQIDRLIELYRTGAKEQRETALSKQKEITARYEERLKKQRQDAIAALKKANDLARARLEALRDQFENKLVEDRLLRDKQRFMADVRRMLRTEKTRIKNMGEAIVKTLASGRYKGKPLSSSTKAILKSFADNVMPTLRNRAYTGKLVFGDLAALLSGDTVELRDAKGNATMVPAPDTEMPLAVIAGLQGRDVSTLDADDLKHLRRLVKWLAQYPAREHSLFVRGKHYELAVAQHEAISRLQAEHKEPFKEGGVSAIGRKLFMDWFAMTKSRVARRILGVEDGTAQYILNEAFSEAEKKYQANLSLVYELTDEMENRLKKDQTLFGKNDADFISVETEIEVNGKAKTEKVTLKRGEAVFVALNSYNDKNRQSLRNGGTLWNDTAIPSLTDAAINDVRDSVINDASLRWWVASIMNAYKQSGEWYNAGSMDAHGWEVAQEDNYYPIERDKAGFITRSEMMSGTLDSIPRLIPRVKSSNKPYNASHPVWFLFQNMEIAARYNAYILPIRNLKYFMFTPTFRNEVQARLGDDPVKWYQDFVRNIESRQIFAQNATKKAMKVVRVVRQNKTLAVLVSVKSWVKQFSSWFLLARHIDPDILVRSGVTILSKNDREMMKKHAPFLHNRLRTGGNIEAYESANLALRGMGRVLRPFRNLGVNANQRIDAFVVGRTWAAAKAQVRRSHKDISVNSDAYWEAVSELSFKIAEECLTNYSPTLRSMFGNNSDEFLRMLTMFSTDRNQLRNLLEDARWDIAHGKKARGARTLTGVLCSMMFLIAVDALLNRWRYRKKEDEEAGFLEKILFGGEGPKWFDVFSSVADQIMSTSYMGSIFDVFSKGYEPRHMSVSAITDLAIDMAGLLDHWVDEGDETFIDRLIPGEESLEYGRRVLESASQLLGFNVNFLERDFIVPILMRVDWTKYDAYARVTKMGLGAADFYPYVQSAVSGGNKEDMRQLAEVLAKYVVDKQKVNDSAATYPYRSTNWYREEKMKHETTGAPNKYAEFDEMYYSAYRRFGGQK
jgi:hypothetical protein